MPASSKSHDIYLEIGKKKAFAVALDWPGWCRFGKDEESAVQVLLETGPRYAELVQDAQLPLAIPGSTADFRIVDRLEGNAVTDFGAPDIQLPDDWDLIGPAESDRVNRILKACWRAFDRAVQEGTGRELQKGSRGGGRDLEKIIEHVVEAEEAYLRVLGWKISSVKDEDITRRKDRVRGEVLRGLEAAAGGQLPRKGPRGGKRWPPRFFVRRLAWHAVDHAWEIEDRLI